jgi:DNA adenine methylase
MNRRILKVQRPILRYHGGKFLLADWIISHFPEHEVYTETFGGAGSVLLKKNRTYAEVYNDLDGEVVNLFRIVRDRGDELREKISLTPFSRDEFVKSFRLVKNPLERARRTVIRSFMGFGSGISFKSTGFRANSNRSGTIPARDWCNLPDAYTAIIERLKGVIVENRDWHQVALQHDSAKTLHFFDPPYVLDTRFMGQKTSIYKYEMSDGQHEDFCSKLISLKGMSIISAYDNDIYNDLLPDFRKVHCKAYADGAKERVETLFISPNTPKKQSSIFDLIREDIAS